MRMKNSNSRIWIVDDDKIICLLHSTILQRFSDYPIDSHTNPVVALNQLHHCQENGIQLLIFLDLNMPEMTGWEFLNHLEAFQSSIDFKVVIVSSSINSNDLIKAELNPLTNYYIIKPLKSQDIYRLAEDPDIKRYLNKTSYNLKSS